MQIVHTIPDLQKVLRQHPNRVLVPTMGNLHDGHLSLLRKAQTLGDTTVVSIFVNRLQFLPHEDFDSYPRTLEADAEKLQDAGCNIVFAPSERDLYPQPQTYRIQPNPELADILEGQFRPGFFTGVCTVVMKLLACSQPQIAVFGQKDYQQLMVVRHMVQQFAMPVQIVAGETKRAGDGLALSSRNGYLDETARAQATALPQTLQHLAAAVQSGERNWPALEAQAMQTLSEKGWKPDYLTIRQQSDLQPPSSNANHRLQPLVALGAAKIGNTRLIDNLEFEAG